MISIQDLILSKIEKVISDYELQAVVSYSASNVGNVYVKDELDNVVIIHFNFQNNYCSLNVYNELDQKVDSVSNGYLEYKNSNELKQFLTNLDDYCREYDMEKEGCID